MADLVATRTLMDGPKHLSVQLTNISDGTGEAGVVKVDRSELAGLGGAAVQGLTLMKAQWRIAGFDAVALKWDHADADAVAVLLPPGAGDACFRSVGGLRDPTPAVGTGDLVLTTDGAAAGATYDIYLEFRKELA